MQGAELDSIVRAFSRSESHVVKRNKSQRGNRKLNGSSAPETALEQVLLKGFWVRIPIGENFVDFSFPLRDLFREV